MNFFFDMQLSKKAWLNNKQNRKLQNLVNLVDQIYEHDYVKVMVIIESKSMGRQVRKSNIYDVRKEIRKNVKEMF